MPEEWKITLQNSSITLNEQLENPQAVIDALDFYHHQHNTSLSKYMYPSDKNISITTAPATPNIYAIEKANHASLHHNHSTLTNSVSKIECLYITLALLVVLRLKVFQSSY